MKVIVHEFDITEIDDPDIYAAEPLYNWEKSLEGQWVIKHSKTTPSWHKCHFGNLFGWKYIIKAELEGAALTEWLLKHEPIKFKHKY